MVKFLKWIKTILTNSENQRASNNGLATNHQAKSMNCYFKQWRFISAVNHIMDRNSIKTISLKQHLWINTAQNPYPKRCLSRKTHSVMLCCKEFKISRMNMLNGKRKIRTKNNQQNISISLKRINNLWKLVLSKSKLRTLTKRLLIQQKLPLNL